ncbi:MAG: STAS domain-containing protein [Proteocatella sp.]
MSKFINASIAKSENYNKLIVSGEIDLNTIEILKPKIDELLKENKDILIDMEDVKFIDSTGLGTLVKLYKEQKLKEKKVTIINTKTNVRKIFKITYMEEMFNLGGEN